MAGDPRYGTTISTFVKGQRGLDRNMRTVTGPRAVLESIARRWLTPRGSLITNPNIGEDVRAWIGSGIAPDGNDYAKKQALITEALRDDRVDDIDLDFSFDRATETLTISATVRLAGFDQPFDLVLIVDAVTATILTPGLAA
jgi:hypothetical protein